MMNQEILKLHSSGKMQEIISGHIEKMVSGIVSDVFREYGDFGKSIKEQLKEKLRLDPDTIALTEYNLTVAKVVKERLDRSLIGEGVASLQKMLDEMLITPPKEITMSQLMTAIIEANQETATKEGWEKPTLIIDESSYGSRFVYIDPEPEREKNDCEYRFLLSSGDKKPFAVEIRSFGKDVFSKKYFTRGFGDVETMLFWMHSGQVTFDLEGQHESYYYEGRD